ncbi:hypothetical protein BTUL_0195g00140 [Botrytis tulipae]|uniref:Uncharacterized protein n=1 Tax=Botrytis tulipae TaxID=87230 RepID=A0A4Z1ED96_9HELO|nr:hypothetical protein BTUL_0195g00140 [Botrytis tulipae]
MRHFDHGFTYGRLGATVIRVYIESSTLIPYYVSCEPPITHVAMKKISGGVMDDDFLCGGGGGGGGGVEVWTVEVVFISPLP